MEELSGDYHTLRGSIAKSSVCVQVLYWTVNDGYHNLSVCALDIATLFVKDTWRLVSCMNGRIHEWKKRFKKTISEFFS